MDGTERANGPMMQPCAMLMMMGRETRADVQREEEEKRRMDRVLCMCAIVFTNYGINETQLQIDI